MATNPELIRLVDAYSRQRANYISVATKRVLEEVRNFSDWYDHGAINKLVVKLVRTVNASQKQSAVLTDAYLAQIMTILTDKRIRPVGPVKVEGLRGGVPSESVYGRLADNYRYLRSTGMSEDEVARRVSRRAKTLVHTDNVLALRAQTVKSFGSRDDVLGYRRVIHPEKSKTGTCGLCLVAADRVYGKKELMPIHEFCKCEPMAIMRVKGKVEDPGLSLNRDDLNELYRLAGGKGEQKLRKIRGFTVHQHGELGPYLVYKGQHFRSNAA